MDVPDAPGLSRYVTVGAGPKRRIALSYSVNGPSKKKVSDPGGTTRITTTKSRQGQVVPILGAVYIVSRISHNEQRIKLRASRTPN